MQIARGEPRVKDWNKVMNYWELVEEHIRILMGTY
jgi:hypothetical protein